MNDNKVIPVVDNENTLDFLDIKRMVSDFAVSRDVVSRVVSDDLADRVMLAVQNDLCVDTIVAGSGELMKEKGRTEVYFWGGKGSGKTTVIGAVLAAQAEGTKNLNSGDAQKRCEGLCRVFASTDADVLMPDVETSGACDVLNVNIKDKDGKTHPLSLVEMNTMSVNQPILSETQEDKIHILCYDSTNAGVAQDNSFINLLNELKKSGVLDHSVGVYLLVTKIDALTHVPKDYRAELAQTMITADHRDLWMAVKNVCHSMQISDAAPIPFTIGNVVLVRLVKVDHSFVNQFIERPLALKSMPYRSWIGKVLGAGSWWTTVLVLLVVVALIAYLAMGVVEQNKPMPKEAILPLDYYEYFAGEVDKRIKGRVYFDAVSEFLTLDDELNLEKKIELRGSRRLLKMHEYAECKRELYDTFEDVVYGGLEYEFKNTKWSESTLVRLQKAMRLILDCRYLSEDKRQQLTEARNIVADYFLAKDLVGQSKVCYSEEDVEDILNKVEKIDRPPLNTNEDVLKWLEAAKQNAINSTELVPTFDENFDFR